MKGTLPDELYNNMKKLILYLIRLYQKHISPLKTTKCPYYPCCSNYGIEAVEKYGAVRGGALTAWRILRLSLIHI